MAAANVKITIVGGSQAIKDLDGVTRGAQKAGAAEVKAARDVERAAKKAADAQTREAKRAAFEADKAAKQAGLSKTRAAEKAAKDAQKIAERAARDAERAEAKQVAAYEAYQRRLTDIAAQAAREREAAELKSLNTRRKEASGMLRRAGGVVGALGMGVVAGGASAMGVARGVTGVQDRATNVQNANSLRERLIITSGQANLDGAGMSRVQGQLTSAAMASGTSPTKLMDVLETGQSQFNDLKFFADNLTSISVRAKATGSDVGDFGRAMGFAKQAFGLTGEEAMEAADLMVAAASKGSIEVKDFARDFAPVMGVFAQGTKMSGLSGFREMLGVSQAAGTLGAGSAETSTMVERLIAIMQNPERMEDLKAKTGIDVKGKTPTQVIDALATSAKFAKPGVQADIFGGDIIANKAITALISARARTLAGEAGAIDIKSIANVDSAEGATQVTDIMKRLESGGVLELQRQAIEMENDTIEHLDEYNAQILAVTKMSNKLEKAFGTLSLWAGSIGIGGAVSTVGGMALNTMTKAKAAANAAEAAKLAGGALAGTGGLLATGGTAVGALGAGTIAAGVLSAGAVGAGVGMAIDAGAEALFGKAISTWLGEMASSGVDADRAALLAGGEVDVKTEVTVHDNRTEVKQTTKKPKSFHTGRGPHMLGSGGL